MLRIQLVNSDYKNMDTPTRNTGQCMSINTDPRPPQRTAAVLQADAISVLAIVQKLCRKSNATSTVIANLDRAKEIVLSACFFIVERLSLCFSTCYTISSG
ncbi:hypothetical protein CRM22_008874 [Opisthorchis felineus]|uniref:Uncharacterized protein n=1 Tax=Opisthorchis felineus TaxID=147828 RepID=A0A4V3SD94_OPIFE|nr:hypothetical protein CRM22_008874 [Opisthorchis felineus]